MRTHEPSRNIMRLIDAAGGDPYRRGCKDLDAVINIIRCAVHAETITDQEACEMLHPYAYETLMAQLKSRSSGFGPLEMESARSAIIDRIRNAMIRDGKPSRWNWYGTGGKGWWLELYRYAISGARRQREQLECVPLSGVEPTYSTDLAPGALEAGVTAAGHAKSTIHERRALVMGLAKHGLRSRLSVLSAEEANAAHRTLDSLSVEDVLGIVERVAERSPSPDWPSIAPAAARLPEDDSWRLAENLLELRDAHSGMAVVIALGELANACRHRHLVNSA